jgi:hypothetical protein
MEITVEIKTVYGNKFIYPICDKAKNLAALAGTKTLTDNSINVIKKLGYEIKIKPQTL